MAHDAQDESALIVCTRKSFKQERGGKKSTRGLRGRREREEEGAQLEEQKREEGKAKKGLRQDS